MKLKSIQLIFLSLSLIASPIFAANALEMKDQELQTIKEKINGLTQSLSQAKTQQQNLQQQLKPIEISIGTIANQLTITNDKLEQEKNSLTALNHQQLQFKQQLQQQQTLLAQQVRAAYMLGQDQYIKMLLNQDQPQNVSRFLVYYRYTNNARITLINDINQTLAKLVANHNQIQTQTTFFSNSLQQERQQQAAIKEHYKKRQFVLAQLTQQINTKSKKLLQLQFDQAELQKLINTLKKQAITIIQPKVPFTKMRGKLPWPTRGAIIRNFGASIDSSDTTYKGILISAAIGQPVNAVYPGKVVFANWLGGVGLLIIIQHDQNYMTLYGHAHSMLVKVGEYVREGQEIATVGQSGGSEHPGLFFQIRRDGVPINPRSWCK